MWVVDSRFFPLYLFIFSLYVYICKAGVGLHLMCVFDSRIFFWMLLAPLEDMSVLGS